MKTLVNTNVFSIILLTVVLTLVSCNKKKKATTVNTNTAIAAEITDIPTYRESIVFIAGKDTPNSSFYKSAKTHFEEKQFEVITTAFSLQEIILWLNNNFDERLYTDIHIVSKNNPWKGMGLETKINGEKVKQNTLRNEIINGNLPRLEKVITEDSNIIFHASSLSNNTDLVRDLKSTFSTNISPKVTTTTYINVFGGQFSNHFLAKPYYGFYPTANSPGKVDLSKEFAKNYPNEKEVDWYTALTNENERFIGDSYTTQFNVPVKWELDYIDSDGEVPSFKSPEEIMDWIDQNEEISKELAFYNIPIEKFRWKSVSTKNKLVIKGITTVLCVLKPLINPYGDLQHIEPEIDNLRLYTVE